MSKMRTTQELIKEVKSAIVTVRTYNEYQMLLCEVWHKLEKLDELEERENTK